MNSRFWDAEHWCGPTHDKQVRRSLVWDPQRKWYRCYVCGFEISMTTRPIPATGHDILGTGLDAPVGL